MEACWHSSVGPRGRALNHRMLRWLKTVVVSDPEKARLIVSGGDQEDVPEARGRGDLVGRALLRRRNSETASKPVANTNTGGRS